MCIAGVWDLQTTSFDMILRVGRIFVPAKNCLDDQLSTAADVLVFFGELYVVDSIDG